jgi:hypothetical protein
VREEERERKRKWERERVVLFNDAVICCDYRGSTADELNMVENGK